MELPEGLIGLPIKRGAILHSYIFKNIDHGKFFVVIGVSEDCVVGFFFINSNITPAIMNKPEQLNMQYLLKRKDYDFLRYDSFLCCTNILPIDKSELVQSIQKGETNLVGELLPQHETEILDMVRESKLFSKMEKDTFFY